MSDFLADDRAVAGWEVLALGAVVSTQYLYHVLRMSHARGRRRDAEAERDAAVDELDAARRDHALTRLENQVLREFVSQTRPEQAIDLLLRRFVPKPEHGFAALIERSSAGTTCEFSRGLSPESLASLRLSEAEFGVVHEARLVTLEGPDVADSSVIAGLARHDAAKARKLHLVALGPPAEPMGVFTATSLFPAGAPFGQQAELAKRLMTNLAASLKLARTLREREAQLRIATQMLDLRAVADRRYGNPLGLVEAFLTALRPKAAAEAAALFLFRESRPDAPALLARCGGPAAAGPAVKWRRCEEAIARLAGPLEAPRALGADELPRLGVPLLVRSALLLPLRRDGVLLGVMLLTRSEPAPFTADERTLAVWSAEFLAHVFPRVINQAVVERQAKQDGLTGLANRRAFDAQLALVLDQARQTGSDVSLLLCDLDRFKAVNDTFGHRAGDELLRAVAKALQEEVFRMRSSDWALMARYGGEELAVLLPGFAASGALRIAEGIRAAVERTSVVADGRTIHATMSIGLATCPQHGDTPEALVARADEALYAAKASGRNRVCCADETPARSAAPAFA